MDGTGNTFSKDGQDFEVRFFDPKNFFDLRDLREIVQSPGVQQWMSSVRNMTHKQYGKWMSEQGKDNNCLFAIADSKEEKTAIKRVHGFIYFYPSEIMRGAIEVSYAKRPGAPGGLTAPALKISSKLLKKISGNEPKVLAEIERSNEASIVVIEKAGFVKYRNFDRHGNGLWILDWGILKK